MNGYKNKQSYEGLELTNNSYWQLKDSSYWDVQEVEVIVQDSTWWLVDVHSLS